ncbi:MAG: MOSC domain-containing protein [Bacteroidetes bacterium]|nr:MOSC domain-containing protein [Bacteroidota bacterium]
MKILSTNISSKKGTIKKPVDEIIINELGVENDAHSGNWHRQVSMLGVESIEKFSKEAKRKINYGEFAENITTEGLVLYKSHILDRFKIGNVELELTQIGKECHGTSCAIFNEVGNCVMPKEGIFCRVIKGGTIKAGDEMFYYPKIFKAHIITLSDRASRGEYADRSGPRITENLEAHFNKTGRQFEAVNTLISDDAEQLTSLVSYSLQDGIDIIFTTGGTGIGQRDITVDVLKPLFDKEIPGIMDFIRMKYGVEKPNALISRSVAGIIGNTFVFALPGSVKAVDEYCTEILKVLDHLFLMMYGIDAH